MRRVRSFSIQFSYQPIGKSRLSVSADHPKELVDFPVSGTGKRITLTTCIGAYVSALKPEFMISRKTVAADLVLTGVKSEKMTIRSQHHRFVATALFDAWFEATFLPELTLCRALHGYRGPVVLFLDNCSARVGDRFRGLCDEHRVVPCYFPPHSSNQLQLLDLCLFGLTKRFLPRANKLDAMNIQTLHIASVVCLFLSAAVPLHVVKTFGLSGICLVDDAEVFLCTMRPDRVKRLLVPLPLPFAERVR